MAIPYLCVLLAAILPILFAGYAKFSTKGYDNSAPREFLEKLQGKGKRAHYAHLNSFEAFPVFAASVIIARIELVPVFTISILSVLFIVFRIIYGFLYIYDKPSLRSLAWGSAYACVVILFIQAILHSRA